MEKEKEDILAKWMAGELNAEQEQRLRTEVDLDKLKAVLTAQEQLELDPIQPESVMWTELQAKMDGPSTSTTTITTKRRLWIGLAILACLGAIALFFFYNKQVTISTAPAETKTQLMADKSEIILGPKSSLSYSSRNWNAERKIQLTGQAFFKVAKGAPFSVHTSQGIVTVLGTEFEVRSLSSEQEVNCFEGRVSVEDNGRKKVLLTAGETVHISKSSLGQKNKTNLTKPSFMNGESRYDQILTTVLLNELQRFYDIEVIADNLDLSDTFTGIIATNELDKACKTVATTFGWTYTIEGRTVRFSQ